MDDEEQNRQAIFAQLATVDSGRGMDGAGEDRMNGYPVYDMPPEPQYPSAGDVRTPLRYGEDSYPEETRPAPRPDVRSYGDQNADSWDDAVEYVPVYRLPDGREHVGSLADAPPSFRLRNLQPVEYLPIRRAPWRVS